MELACRFQWPPQVVAQLTDAYLDELIARLNAEADHAEIERKRQKRDARRRRGRRGGGATIDEDAPLDAIT